MEIINNQAPAGTKINGHYANYFKVGHNAFEFFFDFGQSRGESEEVSIHTRIVTAPGYAKTFTKTLNESIAQYEREFGTIRHDYEGV